MSGFLRETHLPAVLPENLVVCPTMNRWGEDKPGPLADLLRSTQLMIEKDGMEDTTGIVLADSSTGADVDALRARRLNETVAGIARPAPVYLLTPQTQELVLAELHKRTGVARSILAAILTNTGYASNRQKLDALAGGSTLYSGKPMRVATFDDDTVLPTEFGVVPERHVRGVGLEPKPNSQMLLHDAEVRGEVFEYRSNTLRGFFEHLGRTIGDVRSEHPGLRVTRIQHDTMNEALQDATDSRSAQFVVTSSPGPEVDGAEHAHVIAAAGTKFGIPDYRTVAIAMANLLKKFPDKEVDVQSVLSGDPQLFGFQVSKTNVDSAALARVFNERTAHLPWWFVSSDAISRENPLQTVTGHYRADNELLPTLLEKVSGAWGELQVYLSGIRTQVFHNRARSGYRPNLPTEQAPASLVGNIAATQAMARLLIMRDGSASMEDVADDYQVPEEIALSVFEKLKGLADVCAAPARRNDTDEYIRHQYEAVYRSLEHKLAGFDFRKFHRHLNTEVRDQLRFFSEVLDAYPRVLREISSMIARGQYPVQEFVANDSVSVPVSNHLLNGQYPASIRFGQTKIVEEQSAG